MTTTNSAYDRLSDFPPDLRFPFKQMLDLNAAGWEMRSYTGGGPDDRTQFVKVEFRRVRRAHD